MKYLLILIAIISFAGLINQTAKADCITGFACSIKDMEQKHYKQQQTYIKSINNYFSKSISDNLFFYNPKNKINYNELFIFNTLV